MKQTRIGLLGCGLISQFAHLAALQKADAVEFTAVCDIAEDLAEEIARRHGVPLWYSSLDRFLAESGIDAVLIATADQYHVPHAIECLRQSKHVLVEKPLGTNLEECRELASAVGESGCKLQVANMKRYDPGIEFAHQFITTRMGSRLSVSGWYCDTAVRPQMQASLRVPLVRSTRQQGFDPKFRLDRKAYKLMTHGNHLVNTLRYLGGEIVAVQTKLAQKNEDLSWHGLLEFADGAVGHFELTTAVKMGWLEGFRVHGERGSVEIRSFLPFEGRASRVRVLDAGRCEYASPMTPDSDSYERQIEAFARAIQNDWPVTPDVHDGIADMLVLNSIRMSIETNQWVRVG